MSPIAPSRSLSFTEHTKEKFLKEAAIDKISLQRNRICSHAALPAGLIFSLVGVAAFVTSLVITAPLLTISTLAFLALGVGCLLVYSHCARKELVIGARMYLHCAYTVKQDLSCFYRYGVTIKIDELIHYGLVSKETGKSLLNFQKKLDQHKAFINRKATSAEYHLLQTEWDRLRGQIFKDTFADTNKFNPSSDEPYISSVISQAQKLLNT